MRQNHDPRKCAICGEVYIPKRIDQMTCTSPDCRREWKYQRMEQWRARNPEYSKEYMRQLRGTKEKRRKRKPFIAEGYAERQIEKTLKLVSKINTEL